MYRRIVVPVDLDAGAGRSVMVGGVLARQVDAELELLTVVPGGVDLGHLHDRLAEAAADDAVDAATRVTEADDVAAAIAREGAEPGSLVCMDTRARRAVTGMVLGSVSEEVVRELRQPVLLVGPHCATPPRRFESLVVGLDGSELAEQILPIVVSWTIGFGLTPFLFQVLPATVPLDLGDDAQDSAYVRRIAEQLAGHGVRAEWDVVRQQSAPEGITSYAADRRAALIAVTTHGRTGLRRVALGSAASDITRRATVPVLVVHPGSTTDA